MATRQQRQDGAFVHTPHDHSIIHHRWVLAEQVFRGDRLGRPNGNWVGWQVLVCVNTDCPAEARIREGVIAGLIPGDNR